MNRLNIIAGHNNNDPGATSSYGRENEATIRLREAIIAYLNYKGVAAFTDDDNDDLRTVVKKINSRSKRDDITLSLHFNAFNGKASGTEVFVYHGASEAWKSQAKDLVAKVTEKMGISSHGKPLKYENEGAHSRLAILNDTVTNSMLLEVCFIDNRKDMVNFQSNFDDIVRIIGDHLIALL